MGKRNGSIHTPEGNEHLSFKDWLKNKIKSEGLVKSDIDAYLAVEQYLDAVTLRHPKILPLIQELKDCCTGYIGSYFFYETTSETSEDYNSCRITLEESEQKVIQAILEILLFLRGVGAIVEGCIPLKKVMDNKDNAFDKDKKKFTTFALKYFVAVCNVSN